jgi:hypothetical protein
MADVALTDIRHGRGDEGDVFYPAGTKVTDMKDLDTDTKKELKKVGAIGPEVPGTSEQSDEEKQALRQQVEQLQEELSKAQAELAEAKKAQTQK